MKAGAILGMLLCAAARGATPALTESVVGYGASTIPDRAIEARLAARFKAKGRPVFLMSNPARGLAQGDLLRFADKAVLIDADVWQTLLAEGALPLLQGAQGSVVQLRARARDGVWTERRRLVGSLPERKGYALGAQLLRTLQDAGTGTPKGRLQLSFEGGDLVLLASRSFLETLGDPRDPRVGAEPRTANQSPLLLAGGWPARVVAHAPFRWRAWALDSSGGPSRTLRVDLSTPLPEAMTWDPSTRVLEGTWPEGDWPVEFVASVAGRADTLRLGIRSRRNRPPRIAFDAAPARPGRPWTLLPTVSDSDHAAEDIRLRLVEAPEGATWDSSSGRLDWEVPAELADSGGESRRVRLVATDPAGDSVEAVLEIPLERPMPESSGTVRTDRPPAWMSELGTGRLRRGDTLWYRPVAHDPEDDSLRIVCHGDSTEGTIWDGGRLRFAPRAEGWIRARCEARDEAGHVVPQELALQVPAGTRLEGWLAHRRTATASPWELGVASGAGRLGLLVVDPRRTFLWDTWTEQDWPMLFVGMDLLGGHSRNRLWLDVGGVVRRPAQRFFTGGIVGRLDGRFHPLGGDVPLVVEPSLLAWVHQALVMVDTTGWRFTTTGIDSLGAVLDIRDRYQGVGRQILSDAYADRNAVVLTRVDSWWAFHPHLEAGPSWWREDRLVGARFRQYLGAAVRSRWESRWMRVGPSVAAGWGGGGSGWGLRADLRLETP